MSNPPEPCQCFKHDMFPSDSQRGSFKTLFTTRVGSAVYVIIGKWQRQCRNKEQHDMKTQPHPNNKIHTPIHPGYRVTSPKHWKLSWMLHDCNDWSFQDTTTRKLVQKLFVPFSRTPDQPFCTHCKILVKSNEMSSEPRAEMKPAILSTNANLGRFIGYGEWTSSWTKISYSLDHANPWHPTKTILPGWNT